MFAPIISFLVNLTFLIANVFCASITLSSGKPWNGILNIVAATVCLLAMIFNVAAYRSLRRIDKENKQLVAQKKREYYSQRQ